MNTQNNGIEVKPILSWHDIVRTWNATQLGELLADDVVFYSPVAHTPQIGKAITTMYLTAALHVFGNDLFRYVRQVVGESDAVLEFETEIDGMIVNGVDMIKWNDVGKITEFKVMVRPLKAINLVHQRMGERLRVEEIEPGSVNAHERFQKWRRENPDGFIINYRGAGASYLHRAGHCPHLGDANWEEKAQPGWGSMGNSKKVVSTDKEALAAWANQRQLDLRTCSHCRP